MNVWCMVVRDIIGTSLYLNLCFFCSADTAICRTCGAEVIGTGKCSPVGVCPCIYIATYYNIIPLVLKTVHMGGSSLALGF